MLAWGDLRCVIEAEGGVPVRWAKPARNVTKLVLVLTISNINPPFQVIIVSSERVMSKVAQPGLAQISRRLSDGTGISQVSNGQ